MFKYLFNEKKAAQSAAYFLLSAGRAMSVLKLMKLLYLAERRSYQQFGQPIIGDRLVSMPHGPVLSVTLNHMNGELPSEPGGWDFWVADRAEHCVELTRDAADITLDQLLELSDADATILAETWREFGQMSGMQLRDYTHAECAEWKDPDGSMIPIKFEDLFQALNFTKDQTREYLSRMKEQNNISAAFAAMHS